MRSLIFVIFFLVGSVAFAQPQLSPNAPEDKPQTLRANDLQAFEAAIAPHVAKAKDTYPAAKSRFLSGLPQGQMFFVTTRLSDGPGKFEQIFVAVQSIEGGAVSGTVASEVRRVYGYGLGDSYTFPESQVMDWLITYPDGSEEGNFVGKFLDTYRRGGA